MLSVLDLLDRSTLRVTSYVSSREGMEGTTVWFVEDEHGPVEVFSTREEAEDAILGKRKAEIPLTFLA